ncbi:MAG: CHAT domain-containing protein [Microcoleaceae cyanobacterium]
MKPGFSLWSVLINLSRLGIISLSSFLFTDLLLWKVAIAQSIIPESNSTNTQVNVIENRFDITGGTSSKNGSHLFHSFTEFNLDSGQTANFISPPEIENILTRVTGGNPSTIQGLIQITGGNANLFLINPAGVIFGSEASLNIPGSLTVTTANRIGFEQGEFNALGHNNYAEITGNPNTFLFAVNQPGSIINAGKLQLEPGQNLTLLGGTIINTGELIVPGGQITLATIDQPGIIRLSQTGHLLNLEIDSTAINPTESEISLSPLSLPELLTGSSQNEALGVTVLADGTVQLTASQTSIPTEAGTTVVSGMVDVSQTQNSEPVAGQINILGERIGLFNTEVNAAGINGGGVVRIGGNYRGGSDLPAANQVIINSNTQIIADALQTGNGGEVIIWSEDLTQFFGQISAQSNTGEGGFVEISSKGNLRVEGDVNLSGVNGSVGTLLLDPRNITIVDANDLVETQDPFIEDQLLLEADSNNYTISERTLESFGETANVILEAENNIEIQDLGDNLLNLQATTGSVTFTADADGDGSGSFSMNSDDAIQTNGGSLTISGVGIRTGNLITQGGEIQLQSTGNGNLSTANLSTENSMNSGGNITLTTEFGLIRTENLTTNGLIESGDIQIESGDNIQLGEVSTSANDPIFGQGGLVNLEAVNNIQLDLINTASGFAGGNINIMSQQGSIAFATQPTFSIESHSNNGTGGQIEITASERLNVGLIDARGEEIGGNIILEAEVELTTGELITGEFNQSASASEIESEELEVHSNILLTSDEINLTGNVSGSGSLLLQPATDTQDMQVGGTNNNFILTQNLTAAELAQIQDGFTRIIIGRLDSKGTLNIAGDVTFQDPVLLRSPLGQISTQDPTFTITGVDNASLTLEGGENITVGNLITTGENINLTSQFGEINIGNVQVLSEGDIRLTGREINFIGGNGSIQGQGELILQPSSNSQAIRLGDNLETDALDLSGSDLEAISNGFDLITIGRPRSNNLISWVNDLSFSDPVLLQVPEGSILGSGTIQGLDNASITLTAGTEIEINRVNTAGREIQITSLNGNISTENLSATERVEVNAGVDINTGNIISNQEINLSSDTGDILTGNLQIIPNNTLNGIINIDGFGNITTEDIQTTGSNTIGGNIFLESETGTIQTGQLNTSGLNGAGDIKIEAGNQIKTEEIIANSQTQNGGEIRLLSPQDIEVTSIQTEGEQQGGTIEVVTDQFFRATGTFTAANQQNASLSVLGNQTAGRVTIQQGGDGVNTPFTIGIPSINGTVAPIVEGINTPTSPTVSNPDSGNQNPDSTPTSEEINNPTNQTVNSENTPNNPSTTEEVIASNSNIDPVLETDFDNELSPEVIENNTQNVDSNSLTENSQEFTIKLESGTIASDQVYQSPLMSSVLQVDSSRGQEFVNYLGNQTNKNLTSHQSIDQTLSEITRLTGYKPAILYVSIQENQLEIRLLLPNGQPVFKRINVDKKELLKVARTFTNQIRLPRNLEETDYLVTGKQLYDWLIAPIETELITQDIKTLIFSMDSGLRTIPIAALYDGEQFLVEKYSLGLIPSLSLTDTSYVNLKQSKVLAMGASNFSDPSQPPLPAVPLELNLIVEENRWPGQLFLNEEFTVKNLKNQRHQQHYEIIHLATHGEFLSGGAEQSYIQFWDQKLGLHELRNLKLNQPPVELLVLSACTTAVGDEKAELGFAGLAVQAGVKSALASLWYVSDAGTLGLMTTFYQALLNAPIKAEALRQAQLAMLKGEVRLDNGQLVHNNTPIELPREIAQRGDVNLSHPFYWAGFTMIGSPW